MWSVLPKCSDLVPVGGSSFDCDSSPVALRAGELVFCWMGPYAQRGLFSQHFRSIAPLVGARESGCRIAVSKSGCAFAAAL